MHGQLKPESDKILLEMMEKGVNHPDYPSLRDQWTHLVDIEWSRLDRILTRAEQEGYLAGCETKIAESLEQIAKDIEGA
jgi:hypothetical protein